MDTSDLRSAAQYLRMSTDTQQYSLENQADAIAVYAAQHGYKVVRSYADGAKSGLDIQGRPALANLIKDVISGETDFKTILVYDISRWGRFQDCDESAYYEFICKQAGVAIEYCAEQFKNDGSLTATIIKNLKRAMAGEYSRELSVKVHAGQCRLASQGHYFGCAPGYGLRRVLVDRHNNVKFELAPGEYKSLHTEHTVLAPGPANEIALIHRVYDLFLDRKMRVLEIVDLLNAEGKTNAAGKCWTYHNVKELLSNEKYAGTNIYNRTSKKLRTGWRRNPPSEWVMKKNAFTAIVPMERFLAAQKRLVYERQKYTDFELLAALCAIWCKEKSLTRDIISASPFYPSGKTYQARFGSLTNAYRKIGFSNPRNANLLFRRNLRMSLTDTIIKQLVAGNSDVQRHPRCKCEFRINGYLDVAVVLGRASKSNAALDQNNWQFGYRSTRKPHILIVGRVDIETSAVRDYFLLPFAFLPPGTWVTASGRNYARLERFRFQSLEPFVMLCSQRPLTDNRHDR